MSVELQREHLGRVIGQLVAQGGRVESAAPDHAVLAFGGTGMKPWMHAVHALMTLGTVGIWAAVWAVHWARSRNWRRLVAVDEAGRITGLEWKAGRDGALPTIGKVMSDEGVATLQAGKPAVSFDPGLPAHQLTRIVPLLLDDPGGGARITLINNRWKIRAVTIQLSAPAQRPTRLYWFVLN